MVASSPFLELYRRKKVLVTGHTGFMGGWLTAWLKVLAADVIGFSLPPNTKPALFEVARIGQGIVSVLGDIRQLSDVCSVFREYSPEIVFHLAAQPLVRRSYQDPVSTYATNVMGTVHILEAVRTSPSVRAVAIVTSDKCYEDRGRVEGYREGDAMGGYDPCVSTLLFPST
jgi:CDP-glucose 4,6-dehydratase